MEYLDVQDISESHGTVEYRDIPSCPGYRAGSDGTIWSMRMKSLGWRQIAPWNGVKGYRKVGVMINGKQRNRFIHRLVLEAFIGPCPDGMEGCHNDGDKGNNKLSNLRWDTPVNNANDRRMHGTHREGEAVKTVVLTEAQVLAIRSQYSSGGITQKELGEIYGVRNTTIWWIVHRKTWANLH